MQNRHTRCAAVSTAAIWISGATLSADIHWRFCGDTADARHFLGCCAVHAGCGLAFVGDRSGPRALLRNGCRTVPHGAAMATLSLGGSEDECRRPLLAPSLRHPERSISAAPVLVLIRVYASPVPGLLFLCRVSLLRRPSAAARARLLPKRARHHA